jgi:GTP-binding protein HflX
MQGAGLDLLQGVLEELVASEQISGQLVLSPGQGALRAALYREGHVEAENCRDDGSLELHVTLSRKRYEQLMKEFDALKSLRRESSGACRVTASGN